MLSNVYDHRRFMLSGVITLITLEKGSHTMCVHMLNELRLKLTGVLTSITLVDDGW